MAEDDKKAFPLTQLLPAPVKRRVNALKKLQYEGLLLEAAFFRDVYKLEMQYHVLLKKLHSKREQIITGAIEPTDEECQLDIPGNEESPPDPENEELIKELTEKLSVTKLIEEGQLGIPEFWLTIFKNVEVLNDMIQPHDEPILRYLTDVQLEMNEDNMGFVLKFVFASNPYFTNSCLTKEYEMKCSPDESDPWSFEGPEINRCKGCAIHWNKNMNVTLKTIRKRQRHKSRGAVRTILKCVPNDSFFNFFNPPIVYDGVEIDEETQSLLTSDYEIGHYIKDKIIPHAVLYYTGEALEDEEFDDGDESDEDFDNDDDDDEDEEDEDEEESDCNASEGEAPPSNANPPSGGQSKNKNKASNNKNIQQPDCAQQ